MRNDNNPVFEDSIDDDDFILDDKHIDYSELALHSRSKTIQKKFNVEKLVSELTVAEKIHFDEVYSSVKYLLFFGEEPTHNRDWHNFLEHNIRVHALYKLSSDKKIELHGFDSTSAMGSLKTGPNTEILAPATDRKSVV